MSTLLEDVQYLLQRLVTNPQTVRRVSDMFVSLQCPVRYLVETLFCLDAGWDTYMRAVVDTLLSDIVADGGTHYAELARMIGVSVPNLLLERLRALSLLDRTVFLASLPPTKLRACVYHTNNRLGGLIHKHRVDIIDALVAIPEDRRQRWFAHVGEKCRTLAVQERVVAADKAELFYAIGASLGEFTTGAAAIVCLNVTMKRRKKLHLMLTSVGYAPISGVFSIDTGFCLGGRDLAGSLQLYHHARRELIPRFRLLKHVAETCVADPTSILLPHIPVRDLGLMILDYVLGGIPLYEATRKNISSSSSSSSSRKRKSVGAGGGEGSQLAARAARAGAVVRAA